MSHQISRLFDFAYYQQETHQTQEAFVTKKDSHWKATSIEEFIQQGNALSLGLLKLGLKSGDTIAIITSTNRTEWNLIEFALAQIGAITVPIYPTISEEEFLYIFNHAEIKHCFLSDKDLLEKINSIKKEVKTLDKIYSFDKIEGCNYWEELLYTEENNTLNKTLSELKITIKSTDLATIIYTSGTTGTPKGVMLSHRNIVSNVLDSSPRLPAEIKKAKALSFLPVCHIFERMLHYLYMYSGTSIWFAESIDQIGKNLKEVKPKVITVVPRLIEKVYEGILAKGAELKGISKILFYWALSLGLAYEPYGKNGWWYHFKLKIANKLIFSKWREGLGGNLTTMVSGSAALQPRLAKVFTAAKMTVLEGYGLTETSPVISVNMYKDRMLKYGAVGKPIDNVVVKIAEDGEILVKGPNVMLGYYKDEEKTKLVMDGEFFKTGDKGTIDSEGFLKITGRKKEIFKTSGGKYISPILIENEMKQSRFIEQILVLGEGQKMVGAIIQPNFEFIKKWYVRKFGTPISDEAIVNDKKVIERIQEEINTKNTKFGKWETIKKFELTATVWNVENGLLTPTMKPKRSVIIDTFKHLYNKIYEIEA